jgi:DNA-binding transcriptional ArsR family regulator
MADSAPLIDNPEIITLLKAVANEQRFLIVKTLMKGERNVGELESCLTLTQSALSQHLARLRRDNIVQTRRQAQLIYYSLHNEKAASLIKYLDEL